MPIVTTVSLGKVAAIWGSARIRLANGRTRVLEVGDMVRQSDRLITAQDGIVEIRDAAGTVTVAGHGGQWIAESADAARARATALASDEVVDRVIAQIESGDPQASTAAGAVSSSGEAAPALRVDRIAESIGEGSLGLEIDASFVLPRPAGPALPEQASAQATSAPPAPPALNGVPVARAAFASGLEDGAAINVNLSGSDPEDGDAVSVTVLTLPAPAEGRLFLADGVTPVVAGSSLSAAQAASLLFVPSVNFHGTVSVAFTVSDSAGATSPPVMATIVVVDVNDAPLAVGSLPDTNADDASAVSLATAAAFSDADVGDALAYSAAGLPTGLAIDPVTGLITGTLPANASQGGPYSVTVTATDGQGQTATQTFSLTALNPAPSAGADGNSTGEDGPTASGSVFTNDSDPDGDALAVSAVGFGAVVGSVGAPLAGAWGTLTLAADGRYTYAPGAAAQGLDDGEVAVDVFTYTASDGNGGLATTTLAITVTGSNDAPTVGAVTGATPQDVPVAGNVLANASDVDAEPISVTAFGVAGVAGSFSAGQSAAIVGVGTLTIAANGAFTFIPALNYTGAVPLVSFTVSDGAAATNGTLTLVVTAVNDAPVATSTTITVAEESADTPLGLTAPSDVDGDALTITITGLPTVGVITLANGTAVINGQVLTSAELAGLQFDAPADLLVGTTTSFTYAVFDGTVTVGAGTTITINPVNDAPVTSSTTITVAEESADTPLGLTAPSDVDGDALTITITGLPSVGTVTLANGTLVTNGQVLTGAELAGLQFDAPADLLAGTTTSFTYSVFDGTATVAAGTTITVNPVNDAPVTSSTTITVAEESADTPLGLTAPSDVDGDALTITITGLPTVGVITLANGTAVINGQVLTGAELAGLQFDAPADLLSGTTTSFTYSVFDGTVTVAAGTTITVNPVNDAPVTSSTTITVAEESADTPLGLTAPSDVDGDALTITITGLPSVGTVTLANGTAVISGQVLTGAELAGLQFDAPADLLSGTTTSFTYSVFDGTVTVAAGTTITISPVNDAPVASSTTITVAEESADTPLGLVAPIDVDGDTLTITVTGLPSVGTITLADGTALTNGQVLTAAQLAGLQFDAPTDQLAGTTTAFTYSVFDGTATVVAGTTITVNPVNDPPVAANDTATTNEDIALTIAPATLLGNDTDIDGNSLMITSVQGAVNGTVALVAGNVVFTPTANYNGPASFTYTISDGQGGTSTATVNAVNDPPVATNDTATTNEDTALTIAPAALLGNDTDIDGNPLTIASVQAAVNGTVALVAGNVVFTPSANYNGSASFTYTISDGQGGTSTATVNVTVNAVNDPPVAVNDTATTNEDTALTIAPATLLGNDTDVEGNPLTITSVQGAVNGTVALVAGNVVFTPAANYNGSASFTYTISDGQGGTSTATVNVTVNAVNDPPVAVNDTATTNEDTALTIAPATLLGNDTDIDGNPLTITSVQGAVNGTVALVAGSAVFTPTANYNGPASFTYTISDGQGGASTATVNVTVNPVNDAPVATASQVSGVEDQFYTFSLANFAATDVDGSVVSVTITSLPVAGDLYFNGVLVAASGQVVTVANLAAGLLTFRGDANQSGADVYGAAGVGDQRNDYAKFNFTVTDNAGAASNAATMTVDLAPVADAPTLVMNGTSITGGSTVSPPLPASSGLTRQFYDNIAALDTANAGNIATVEAGVESTAATSSSTVTNVAEATIGVDDAYRFTGYIYLAAGQTYAVSGSRDDTLLVKLGGETVFSMGYNTWGAFTAAGFTPAVAGYYSVEVIAYNGNGAGNLDINLSVNGAPAVDLNTTNFRLYPDSAGITAGGTFIGALVAKNDGGYYPAIASGNEDSAIALGRLAASLNDTDGSETLNLVIGAVPVGATLSDGTNSFTATAGSTSVAVTGWSLASLTLTPPSNFSGTVTLAVTATATDFNGSTATSQGALAVQVVAVADAPALSVTLASPSLVFANSWESTVSSNATSEAVALSPFEGWTRIDTPDAFAGGTNVIEVWTTGDSYQRQDGSTNVAVASAGNGEDYVELNDASANFQTIGLSRSVATQVGMVYELSLDYAGRPGFTADFTRIGVYRDGVLIQQFAATSPQASIDWHNLHFSFVGDGAAHTLTIRTDATSFDANGRGAFIDDLRLLSYQGLVSGNVNAGATTSIALATYVNAALVDLDGSESLALAFSGVPAGALIVTSANPGGYAAVSGTITIAGSELASAQLQFASSVTGHLSLGVTAISTEASNGVTASTSATLELSVIPVFSSTDLAGDGLTDVLGTAGNDTLNGGKNADLLVGRDGDDAIIGNNGADFLDGGNGNDALNGGSGNDVLYGGAGSDALTGGTGADVFRWTLADRGTPGSGPTDTIADFENLVAGESLDLRDLLIGEHAGNLSNYLHFTTAGGNTTLSISSGGGFSGGFNTNAVDQTIQLNAVNLVGSFASDAAVIADLLSRGKLVTDNV